jgi:hypothetical protein
VRSQPRFCQLLDAQRESRGLTIDAEKCELVLRLARENPRWDYAA